MALYSACRGSAARKDINHLRALSSTLNTHSTHIDTASEPLLVLCPVPPAPKASSERTRPLLSHANEEVLPESESFTTGVCRLSPVTHQTHGVRASQSLLLANQRVDPVTLRGLRGGLLGILGFGGQRVPSANAPLGPVQRVRSSEGPVIIKIFDEELRSGRVCVQGCALRCSVSILCLSVRSVLDGCPPRPSPSVSVRPSVRPSPSVRPLSVRLRPSVSPHEAGKPQVHK